MDTDTLIEKITELHIEHFLPLQYDTKDVYRCRYYVVIRCLKDKKDKDFYADVVVCRSDTGEHEYIDGNFYHDGSGVGYGSTFNKALKNLLEKTKKSINLYKKEIAS